jgi:hypothetical protein
LVVGRLVVIVRNFVSSGGIEFVLEARRGVGLGLVEGNCLGCSLELEVVVCVSVRYRYRSAAIETVVEVDIEIRFGQHMLDDSIGRKIESVVAAK